MSHEGPPPPPPIVKNYVDHQVKEIRDEITPKLNAINQKLAGDHARFDGINRRIDDVRGDVRGLGQRMDTQHRERMDYLAKQPGQIQVEATGWFGRLSRILQVLIVSGLVLGTAAVTFVGAIWGGIGP